MPLQSVVIFVCLEFKLNVRFNRHQSNHKILGQGAITFKFVNAHFKFSAAPRWFQSRDPKAFGIFRNVSVSAGAGRCLARDVLTAKFKQ